MRIGTQVYQVMQEIAGRYLANISNFMSIGVRVLVSIAASSGTTCSPEPADDLEPNLVVLTFLFTARNLQRSSAVVDDC